MKFLFAIAAVLALTAVAFGFDLRDKDWCRKHTGMDADGRSFSANSGCVFNCFIHNRFEQYFTPDYQPCPYNTRRVCVRRQCVVRPRAKKALALTGRPQLGHIDVNMISAQLANAGNAYMAVCIQNSTARVTLPITNRQNCVTCTSNPVNSSRTPIWNAVCSNSGKYLFVSESRVSFEVFDHRGTGQNIFAGGATITIPQMLKNGDNNRQIPLNLVGGNNAGSMQVRVTYTPR